MATMEANKQQTRTRPIGVGFIANVLPPRLGTQKSHLERYDDRAALMVAGNASVL
jgi:hypothetical protein